jgi:hypothetical protein
MLQVDCIAIRENVLGNNGGAPVVLIQFHCADWADIVYNTRQDLKVMNHFPNHMHVTSQSPLDVH